MIEFNLTANRSRESVQSDKDDPRIRRSRPMNIDIDLKQEITIIRPQSDIDSFNVSKLKEKLRDQVENGRFNIIMDLERVRFMDSAALGILVSGLKTCMQNSGTLGIINPSRNVENLFKITHLDSVFNVYSNEDDAITAMQSTSQEN